MIVACDCGAKLKIDDAKIAGRRVKIRCPRCGNTLAVQQQQPPVAAEKKSSTQGEAASGALILVAHDSDVVRYLVSGVLVDAGFRVEMAVNGIEAMKKAVELRPHGLVLDVGLPGIYGFELCDRLKGNPDTKGIKIILLSSVYDMRRYKRTPASLYGADDYIEKHHIQDMLVVKLRRLLYPEQTSATQPAAPARSELPEMARPPAREFTSALLNDAAALPGEQESPDAAVKGKAPLPHSERGDATAMLPESISLKASVFQEEECSVPVLQESDPAAIEKARRFARIIVSDIALYNQQSVIEGIANGTLYDLLRNDITEGRELYEKRVPASVRAKKDYYQEAFDNFIAAAKKKNVR
ncbi:MAG TPA: response regulator [Nitrospirota bacterium]|nr:response regulator [Nitrospirota bacterium]